MSPTPAIEIVGEKMKNDCPKISVITPSFNSSKYIEQAIQSVLLQNYPNFEHIVMDGGSTDGTVEILKKYPHLKWVSGPDRGQSHAMNKGFTMSTGEIIVYLNSDDFFKPNAFHTVIKHLDKIKNMLVVVGELNTIWESGIKTTSKNTKTTFYEMLQWWKPYSYPKNPVAYFYYREVQDSVGGFDEQKHHAMDYDFLLKVAMKYHIKHIDFVLGNFRFIKGTKTFETQDLKYTARKFSFAKKLWRRFEMKKRIKIYLSYMLYKIELLYVVGYVIGVAKYILKQFLKNRGK